MTGLPCFGRTLAGTPICANARREMAAGVRAGVITGDTGKPHGPVQWLEPAPRECAVPLHIQDRMFTPVDVMRGQTGMEI